MHLVLNTFGTYLAKENGNFVIIHKDGKQQLDAKSINSISISRGAQISSDAALLAIENNIDVFFVDNLGNAVGRIWSNKFGSITTIRRNQIDFSLSSQAVEWIKTMLTAKMDNQIALMLAFFTDDNAIVNQCDSLINKIKVYKSKVAEIGAENIAEVAPSLRGWEGAASRSYFRGLNLFLPEQYRFDERSQHPARDVFNAMLNYGYGMLYGRLEAELIRAGIDPYVGIMHREEYNRPVLTYDVIEKYRIWIDYVVMQLARFSAITSECYSVADDGSVWLENLGRRIVIQSVNDYLEEKVDFKGANFSRFEQLKVYVKNLAKTFLNFVSNDDKTIETDNIDKIE